MPSSKPHAWSLYPDLHYQVSQLLDEFDLHFTFHDVDDPNPGTREYDSNIMGRFICDNKACDSKGWGSKQVAITIRMYEDKRYNARVYFQRCKSCNRSSKPVLDGSYAERIAYRIKKWNGIKMDTPVYSSDNSKGPHQSKLCEGCKAGQCKFLERVLPDV